MRILHVIETMSPRYGGPVAVLRSLAREQLLRGNAVTVATTKSEDTSPDSYSAEHHFSITQFSTQFRSLGFSFKMLGMLPNLILAHDIIHIHGLYRFPTTFAAFSARRLHKPYIIRPCGALDPFIHAQSSKSLVLKRIYEKLFDLPNLRAAPALHFTTEEERLRAGHLHLKGPTFVLPNGLDWNDFQKLPEKGEFRAKLKLGSESPLLLFLGRINFKKGLDLLIEAFAAIRRQHPTARLAIVGPDNDGYGLKVKQMIQRHAVASAVDMLDMITGTDVVAAYVDADLFLLPSYTENFGMTVIEAMACKTPVLISDQVNIHREVEASGGGVVTPCEASHIAEAASALLADPDRRKRMGALGRAWVQQNYVWPSIVEQLNLEYEAIIQRHK